MKYNDYCDFLMDTNDKQNGKALRTSQMARWAAYIKQVNNRMFFWCSP